MANNQEVETIVILLAKLRDINNTGFAGSPTNSIVVKRQRALIDSHSFVDQSRLSELREIKSTQFDLVKLIRYCEELNYNFKEECFLAVTMLGRAILDHVSPIFNCKSFSEVANNYSSGTKSFKQSMDHLENSLRKIADAHLHVQIRKSEVLPNRTQVNFSTDLDVLLAEIVRLLKK
jgi:hypothetical protein